MSESIELRHVAEFDPPPPRELLRRDDPLVAFMPMAAVQVENSLAITLHVRRSSDVLSGYTYFQNGDVLVAKITPCFENGKIGLASIDQEHGFGTTEFHVVRAKTSRLIPKYLAHFLRQPWIKVAGERTMTGSAGQRRVPRHFLENLRIPLLSLEEQQRIAAILDQAEALRAKRRQALAKLDTLTQSLFLEMFGDPRINGMNWPMMKLGEVGILERGISKHRPRNAPELLNGPYPLVQTGDIANSNGRVASYTSTYSEKGLLQSRLWPVGTLCITIAANIAKTATLSIEACFPDSVVGFIAEDFMTTEYVQAWFSFHQKDLEEGAPESAQKNINLAILRNLDIPVPPKSLQAKFSSSIASYYALRDRHSRSAEVMNKLTASIQSDVFRGEL